MATGNSAHDIGEARCLYTLTQPHASGYVLQCLKMCSSVLVYIHENSANIPILSFYVVFQASLFFRNTMMFDKETVRQVKEASTKPTFEGRETTYKGQGRKQREISQGPLEAWQSLTSTLLKGIWCSLNRLFPSTKTEYSVTQRFSHNAGLLHNSKCKWADLMAMYV